MIILIALLTVQSTVYCSLNEVHAVTQDVLKVTDFEIMKIEGQKLITESKIVDINWIDKYIIEEWHDENPGWINGKVQLIVQLTAIDDSKTQIEINALFERYGTPSAFLLIPPEWKDAPSNGKLEKDLLAKIAEHIQKGEEK